MPTLDATPGGTTSNSYCTVAEADAYHESHLYATKWTSAVQATKEAALIWATRLLDEQIEWVGYKATAEQALRFPRGGVLDPDGIAFDSNIIPKWLKDATAELARYLIIEDRTEEQARGLTSVKADVVEVVFDNADKNPILPLSVRAIVRPYGLVKGPGAGWAKLERA